MRTTVFIFIFALTSNLFTAQIHEVGISVGGLNYIGDVGKTNYINPSEVGFGLLYKWNRSPRHAYRFSYTQGTISGNDLQSDVPSRFLRGNQFENSIKELTAGIEFNFFPFDLHTFDYPLTPYLFTGISYFWHDELVMQNRIGKSYERSKTLGIPMVLGIKSRISTSFVLGAEIGARYTFTDNLDGSNPQNSSYTNLRFGNLNSNDWFVYTAVTLTYTFGENPCFCPN